MQILKQEDFSKFENNATNENNPTVKYEKSNFHYAFYFLPKEKYNAILNIYAFFSYLDNIVDTPTVQTDLTKKERLNWWKNQIDFLYSNNYSENKLLPLKQVIEKYQIPQKYFTVLIDGIGVDLGKKHYNNFDELLKYCYGVASIVGLFCINIFVDAPEKITENIKQYAINLGYALQLTNIMRDVYADAKRGYFYLPKEDLLKFNYSEQDILDCKYNENFISMMEFQYERAMNYYQLAENFYQITVSENKNKKQFKSSEIMKKIYFNLLQKLKQKKFNIFEGKISLSKFEKIKSVIQ